MALWFNFTHTYVRTHIHDCIECLTKNKLYINFVQTPQDAFISFTLTDCNDFATVFSAPLYSFTIDEAIAGPAANMDVFTGIVTTDGDATSVNSVKTFSIVDAPSSTNGWFGVDPNTVRLCCVVLIYILLLLQLFGVHTSNETTSLASSVSSP